MKLTRADLEGKRIDAHTHAGVSINYFFDSKYPYCCSIIEIENALCHTGFDAACVFPFPSYLCSDNNNISRDDIQKLRSIFEPIPYKFSMEKMLLEIERFHMKCILPFNMFSINYAIQEQLVYLDSIRNKIYGLKYYPDADARRISDLSSKGLPFLNYLIENDMPLTIHVSENACLYGRGYSNVMDAIELARSMPGLRIAVAHMGHFSKEALTTAQKLCLPNLYFDVSPLLHICHIRTVNPGSVLSLDYEHPGHILQSLVEMFPDHLLWGSDIPFNFTCDLSNPNHNFDYSAFSIFKAIEQLDGLNDTVAAKICGENVISFLFGAKT